MERLKIAGLLLLVLVLLRGVASVGAAEGAGTVRGTVANQTGGAGKLVGQEVTLVTYAGTTEKSRLTTRTDQVGKFEFTGLETAPDLAYQVGVEFQGVSFLSHPVMFQEGTTEQTVQMDVYEATSDRSVMQSTARHFLLQPQADGMIVSEITILKNNSDRVFVGSQEVQPGLKETWRVKLPAGAQDVQYGQGMVNSRVVPIDGGFVDTLPVYPGDAQRIFRYKIPATGDSAAFSAIIDAPTDKVNVLVPDTGVQVSVTNLPDRSNPDMQGARYIVFGGQNLAPGTELQIKVEQLSKAGTVGQPASQASVPAQEASSTSAIPFVGGAAVLGVVAAGAILVRRRRTGAKMESDLLDETEDYEEEDAEGQALSTEKERLVAAIAKLDDSFEQGKMGAEEYGRRRAEKKQQLVALVSKQRALERRN